MHTQHHDTCRVAGRTAYLFSIAVGALCLALALSGPVSAALIVSALDYDGHVRSGLVTGVEEHTASSTPFPPPNASIPLPATNPPLTPPLLASKNLSMTYTTAMELFPSPGGILYTTAIIQISSATGDVFANTLDNILALPVQVDLSVYSDTPGMKTVLDPANIGIENFDLPPFSSPLPGSYTTSGQGTQANPLRIQLGLSASQVDSQNGFVKLHLRFSEMVFVPEPASCVMLLLGLVCLTGTAARGRRR